jgi:hypothetical protein
VLVFEDPRYGAASMSADWVEKRGAKPGGYFIVYPRRLHLVEAGLCSN